MGLRVIKSVSSILLICPLSLMGYVEEKETQGEQVERVVRDLQDENEDVRWNAVEVLRQMGSLDTVTVLMEALKDENEDVRWNAVEALKEIGALDAVPALIQVLKDQNEDVRWNAVQALEKIGTPEALKVVKGYQS